MAEKKKENIHIYIKANFNLTLLIKKEKKKFSHSFIIQPYILKFASSQSYLLI
jgi:hypothetical protein